MSTTAAAKTSAWIRSTAASASQAQSAALTSVSATRMGEIVTRIDATIAAF